MRALGPFWGVAALAALTAFGSMLCQWLCTDVRRLREVKRQTLAIAQALHGISAGSPEDKALSRLLRAGEWRVARAALVPLGLLLGPVLVSFMWLPVRVEPSHINPAPGAHVRMQAAIDGEFNGPLSVRTTGAAFNDGTTSADVQVVSVRSTFEELRRELAEAQAGRPYTPAVRQHLEATGKSAKDADDTLKAFLATPMPPRVLQWSLTAPPGKPQPFSIDIGAGPSGTLGRAQLALATGHAQPPPLQLRSEGDDRILTQKGDAAVHDVRVQFTDPRPPEARAFWRPFALAGLTWDAGWMSLYLAVYLPVMLLTKRLLRLP